MEIYLNVMPRPLSGCEAEFENLVNLIDAGRWGNPPQPHPYMKIEPGGFWGLGRKKTVFDINAATVRFEEISQEPGITLQTPIVGQDANADDWARHAFRKGWLQADDETDVLERYEGLHVYELLPICDGFPVYSPTVHDKGYDRPTLNGTLIAAYSDDPLYQDQIDVGLATELYGPLLAAELADWGKRMRDWADAFAKSQGLEVVLGQRDFKSHDDGGPETCLHIFDQAARWAAFWSERGHGAQPVLIAET